VLFEFYPARIFMGDCGSMFLGFMIGVLSIFSGGKVATAFLVMGFPKGSMPA
jgi:UDP-N-acetylmuramyl pentapeptide phosphotransferase/UDP-N-acetylglucosamine-1-phosphate transferase